MGLGASLGYDDQGNLASAAGTTIATRHAVVSTEAPGVAEIIGAFTRADAAAYGDFVSEQQIEDRRYALYLRAKEPWAGCADDS